MKVKRGVAGKLKERKKGPALRANNRGNPKEKDNSASSGIPLIPGASRRLTVIFPMLPSMSCDHWAI